MLRKKLKAVFLISRISNFFIFIFLGLLFNCSIAKDISKEFTIYSPDYTKKLVYACEKPPFKIELPKNWYLLIKKEDKPGYLRAIFCKYKPGEEVTKGFLQTPFIDISFLPNPKESSAMEFAKNITSKLKEKGIKIITSPTIIKVSDKKGSYFAAPHPNLHMIIENYTFVSGKTFINLRAFFGEDEYKENKEIIRKAVNSIRFSYTGE